MKEKKAFTLIELIIAVSIIGILSGIILVMISRSNTSAKAAKTKQSLTSLKAAIGLCCTVSNNTLNIAGGGNLCSDASVKSSLLTGTQMGLSSDSDVSYGPVSQCNTPVPGIGVTINNHSNSACNATYSVTQGSIRVGSANGFPPGC